MKTGSEPGKSLAGRTLRWKFDDGPTAGKAYEHTFRTDGTVVFREAGAGAEGGGKPKASGPKYASFEVGPRTHLVSYLSDSGYTLTVALDLESRKCWGIASNEKEWYPMTGRLESISGS